MTREPPLMRVHATYPPNTPQSFWRRNRHALWRSAFVLAGYLSLSIYTYIGAILKGEFRLTYGCFGPTEFRLVVILVNTLYMYAGLADCRYQLHGFAFGLFDVVSLAVAVLLFVFYFAQFFKDKKVLAEKDPIKNVKSEK